MSAIPEVMTLTVISIGALICLVYLLASNGLIDHRLKGIQEGKVSKGGINRNPPITRRPLPPKGQGRIRSEEDNSNQMPTFNKPALTEGFTRGGTGAVKRQLGNCRKPTSPPPGRPKHD